MSKRADSRAVDDGARQRREARGTELGALISHDALDTREEALARDLVRNDEKDRTRRQREHGKLEPNVRAPHGKRIERDVLILFDLVDGGGHELGQLLVKARQRRAQVLAVETTVVVLAVETTVVVRKGPLRKKDSAFFATLDARFLESLSRQ